MLEYCVSGGGSCKAGLLDEILNFKIDVGVANGKCETLRDGETSVFLCEPETF